MAGCWPSSFFFFVKINKSTFFNEGNTQQCSTDKLVALKFPIKFRNVGFEEVGKPENPEKKFSEQGREPKNKFYPHMTSGPGMEPGTHWWEASALTTAPPMCQAFSIYSLVSDCKCVALESFSFSQNFPIFCHPPLAINIVLGYLALPTPCKA